MGAVIGGVSGGIQSALTGGSNPIADLNNKLHSSTAYNMFQQGTSQVATFTGGMTSTMKCFVEAVTLCIGDELIDSSGHIHVISGIYREECAE